MKYIFLSLTLLASAMAFAADEIITVTTDKPDAHYKCNDEITFTIAGAHKGKATWTLSRDAANPETEEVNLADGSAKVTTSLALPGFAVLKVTPLDANGKPCKEANNRDVIIWAGAGADTDQIKVSYEPADFDAFWEKRKAEVLAVPLDADLTEVEPAKEDLKSKVKVYSIKIKSPPDCQGGNWVSGYLTVPISAKPLPAILAMPGAGVSSGKPSEYEALNQNAIILNMSVHCLESGKESPYYAELANGRLKAYCNINARDAEKQYMLGVVQRVLKALQYLKSRPEWDKQRLVVMGGSQGGALSLIAAGLDKDVSFCGAGAPWLCDMSGRLALARLPHGLLADQEDETTTKARGYIDAANHAKRITCPVTMTVGFGDLVCPPSSIYAAYNNIGVEKKEIINCLNATHTTAALYTNASPKIKAFLAPAKPPVATVPTATPATTPAQQ